MLSVLLRPLLLPLLGVPLAATAMLTGCGNGDDGAEDRRTELESGIRTALSQAGAPAPVSDCIIEASREELTDEQLEELEATIESEGFDPALPEVQSAGLRIAARCLGDEGAADTAQPPPDAGSGEGGTTTGRYLDCVARNPSRKGIERCEERFLGG